MSKWIPCKERLPEKDGKYLCFYDFKEGTNDYLVLYYVTRSDWLENGWHKLNDVFDRITDWSADMVAWMPLPEPYTED